MITRRLFGQLAETILEGGAKQATRYVSDTLTVKATRQGSPRKNEPVTILFTIGRPNYAEREFIRKRQKAGRRVRGLVQVRWPQKRTR